MFLTFGKYHDCVPLSCLILSNVVILTSFASQLIVMSRRINIGDTVVVVGVHHRGKHAVVLATTPKMFYIKFSCSGDETRVMAYNVKIQDSSSDNTSTREVNMLDRTPTSERAMILANDNEFQAEIYDEIRKMKQIMEQLTVLLQKFQV